MATSLEVGKLCTPKDVGLYYIRHRLQRENAEQMARLLAAEKQEGARWPFPDLLGFRLAEPAEDDTSPKAKAYRAGARYVVLDGVTRLAAARHHPWGTGGPYADVRVQVREVHEKLYSDADHRGAGEGPGPMSELRQRKGDSPTDGVYREDLAEELTPNGIR